MANSDARELLLKFRGDLSALKQNAKDILGMLNNLASQVKSQRDKSTSEAKSAHNQTLNQIKEQAAAQSAQAKAKRDQIALEAAANKAAYQAKLEAMQLEQQHIRLEQQRLALKRQELALQQQGNRENKQGEGSGLSKLFTAFTGSALGGGSVLNTLIAGAAGGGAFMVLEKLAEKLGDLTKELIELPSRAGEVEHHLEQMATRAGVTTQQIQQLSLAGASVHLPMEQLQRILMMMNLQFSNAQGGVSRAEKELARFGVSVRDSNGSLIPTTERLKRIADLFQSLPDGITKSRLAADLFTRRIGSQLIPLLNGGGDALQVLYDRADRYSILVDEKVIESQRKLETEQAALKMQWDQLTVTLGSGLLPKMAKWLEYLNAGVEALGQLVGTQDEKDFISEATQYAMGKTIQEGLTKGPGKYDILSLTESGRKHMKETMPPNAQDQLFGGDPGSSSGVYGKNASWLDVVTRRKELGQSNDQLMALFQKQFPDAFGKAEEASAGLDKRLQDNTKNFGRVREATIKYLEAVDKLKEKTEESNIEAQQNKNKQQFDQGLISQDEYAEKSKELDKQLYDAKIGFTNNWAKLEKQKIQVQAEVQRETLVGEVEDAAEQQEKLGLMEKETTEKLKIVDVEADEKRLDAKNQYEKKINALTIERIQSEQKAKRIATQEDLKVMQESLLEQKTSVEYLFHQNAISAAVYFQTRKDQIKQEAEIAKQTAQSEYDEGKKTLEAQATLKAKQHEADVKAEKDFSDLLRNEIEVRQTAYTQLYQHKLSLAQGNLTAAQMGPAGVSGPASRTAMTDIISVTQEHLQDLYTTQTLLVLTNRQGTEEWYKTLEAIQKANIEIYKMREELTKTASVLIGGGGFLQQVGGLLSRTRGNFGQLATVGGILDQLGTAQTQRSTTFNADKTGASGVSSAKGGVFGNALDAIKQLGDGSKSAGARITDFAKGISGAISAVGGFINMLGSSHGKAGDIFSGAIGGASMGGQIMDTLGSMGGPIGGMISSLGAAAGPIGMAAGAAFGGILSGIIGHKNNQAQDFIENIKKQIAALQTAIQDGSVGLNQGIQQLESMRQTVLQQAHSSKKKQKAQFEQEAQAIQDQIIQLQQQQEAMFYELQQNLKVLNSPTAFQSFLSSLNDIMMQYKKFQGAARDAKDLALANQFLADSLRNYADTQGTALTNAEQSAIEDAIKLNDLLIQRQQLMTSEAQTEYDIMTQGVLVNQRTQAMMKISQIQQARNQYNLELEKINQEIDATNYKVEGEKTIFNLATTRIGLELQLTAVQNALADKDLLRIRALQSIVSVLGSGQSFNTIDQLLAALGLAPNQVTVPTDFQGGHGSDVQDYLNEIRAIRSRDGFSGATPLF